MVDKMIEPEVGSQNNGAVADQVQDTTAQASEKKKGGNFWKYTGLGTVAAAMLGFGISSNVDTIPTVEKPVISSAQKLSNQFPNGRYLDDLSVVNKDGKSIFSVKVPGIVYSDKQNEANRISSHLPKGSQILSTKVNGKNVKYSNSSFLPNHKGDKIEITVGKKLIPLSSKSSVVPAPKSVVILAAKTPIVSIDPKTHKVVIDPVVRKSNLESKLGSTPTSTAPSQSTYTSEIISNGAKHQIVADYKANNISVDGHQLTHSYSDLEAQLLETVNGDFNETSMEVFQNALTYANILIESGDFPSSLKKAFIVDALALGSVKSEIITKYFTESAGDQSVRFAKDSGIKYVDSKNKSDVQLKNIQEHADVKPFVHKPSKSLEGKMNVVHKPTVLAKQMEYANTTPLGEMSFYLASQDASVRGSSSIRAISSDAKEAAFWNVVNQKRSGKDLAKMALGWGSYGSALYAVSKTEYNPLSEMNKGFADIRRSAFGVTNYTFNKGGSVDQAFANAKLNYTAAFENGMSTIGGKK